MNIKRNLMHTAIFGALCNAVMSEAATAGTTAAVAVNGTTVAEPAPVVLNIAPFTMKVKRLNEEKKEVDVQETFTIDPKWYSSDRVKFTFKEDKIGNKRPSFELVLPMPTVDGVVAMLSDEKQTALLLDLLADEVKRQARLQVGDEQNPVNEQSALDLAKLTMKYMSEMPKSERRGGGISKEVWEAFAADYIAIMPAITGKNADAVGNAAKLLLAKFQPVKTNKKVIAFLKTQLGLYFTNTASPEDYAECFKFLDEKADALLAADEASLLANL